MLAAWAKGTERNLFMLWSRTTFQLTFIKSMNKRHWSWVIFLAKNFHNGTNIIAKHDTIFQGEEMLEFFMVPKVKHTLVSWHRRFQPFNLEPKSSACFFDRFKSRMIIFSSPWVSRCGFIGRRGPCKCWITIHIVSLSYIFISWFTVPLRHVCWRLWHK